MLRHLVRMSPGRLQKVERCFGCVKLRGDLGADQGHAGGIIFLETLPLEESWPLYWSCCPRNKNSDKLKLKDGWMEIVISHFSPCRMSTLAHDMSEPWWSQTVSVPVVLHIDCVKKTFQTVIRDGNVKERNSLVCLPPDAPASKEDWTHLILIKYNMLIIT